MLTVVFVVSWQYSDNARTERLLLIFPHSGSHYTFSFGYEVLFFLIAFICSLVGLFFWCLAFAISEAGFTSISSPHLQVIFILFMVFIFWTVINVLVPTIIDNRTPGIACPFLPSWRIITADNAGLTFLLYRPFWYFEYHAHFLYFSR